MNKREIRRHAHTQVYAILQGFLDGGSEFECDLEDEEAIRREIDRITQYHFERGTKPRTNSKGTVRR